MNFWVMRHLFRQKEKMASSHKRSSLCDLTRFIYFLQDKERGSRSKLRCISQRWSSFWSWQASPKVMGDFDQSAGTSDRETKRIDPIHKKKRNYLRAKKVYRMNILLLWMFHVFFLFIVMSSDGNTLLSFSFSLKRLGMQRGVQHRKWVLWEAREVQVLKTTSDSCAHDRAYTLQVSAWFQYITGAVIVPPSAMTIQPTGSFWVFFFYICLALTVLSQLPNHPFVWTVKIIAILADNTKADAQFEMFSWQMMPYVHMSQNNCIPSLLVFMEFNQLLHN